MGKKSGWGLIFKEFYMSKTYLRNSAFAMLIISILVVFPLASFRYGNLRLITSDEAELFYTMAVMYGKYIPVYMFSMVCFTNMEAGIKEESAKWKRFRLVTPVSGFQYAFYKYAFTFIMSCMMIAGSMIYFMIFDELFGGANRLGELGLVIGMMGTFLLLETIMLVYGEFLGSYDKAGLAGVLTFFCVFGLIGYLFREKLVILADFLQSEDQALLNIEKLGQLIFPYALILFLVAYPVGIFFVGLVYKRREK